MAKHVIENGQTATVKIAESDSEWVLAKGATLSGSPAFETDTYDNVTLSIAGEIISSGNGILLGGSMPGEYSDGAILSLTESGRINADFYGIYIRGDDAIIENDGQIKAQAVDAVSVSGDNVSVVNHGLIRAEDTQAISLSGSDVFSIRNTGRILTGGDDVAIFGQDVAEGHVVNTKSGVIDGPISFANFNNVDGSVEIVNKGKIAQDIGASNPGILFEDGNDRLINRGVIGGDVKFGNGDDFGDFRHGSLNGAFVYGGEGDDIFVMSDNSTKVIELPNDGNDAIWTTVSYALFDNIEKLRAVGKNNIDLTGNNQANDLTGNAGDNLLSGGNGNDILTGGRGDDALAGGDGADDFYFYQKTGDDRIVGFNVNEDAIHLGNIPGIGTIDDLESHFTTGKNGDVIIDLGEHGSIRLSGIGEDDVDQIEFQIEL